MKYLPWIIASITSLGWLNHWLLYGFYKRYCELNHVDRWKSETKEE